MVEQQGMILNDILSQDLAPRCPGWVVKMKLSWIKFSAPPFVHNLLTHSNPPEKSTICVDMFHQYMYNSL